MPTTDTTSMPTANLYEFLGVPRFASSALDPVQICDWAELSPTASAAILNAYTQCGFAIVDGPSTPWENDLQNLAVSLCLGEVFIPPVYAGRSHTGSTGISRLTTPEEPSPLPLTAPHRPPDSAATHPAFQNAGAQKLHTDGTLQSIGQVKTTILLCHRPAARGGQSQLFNATGAFLDLIAVDPRAARALMDPSVLVRTSNLPDTPEQSVTGPAFSIESARLITRYSQTSTDRYTASRLSEPSALHRGLQFLRDAAMVGSPHFLQFTLAAGQALIFANDALAHGRLTWSDDPDAPRVMLRALFTGQPASAQAAEGNRP